MRTFQEYILALPSPATNELQQRLQLLHSVPLYRRLSINLSQECRWDNRQFHAMAEALLAVSLNHDELAQACVRVCVENPRCGPPIQATRPQRLGHTVTRSRFKAVLTFNQDVDDENLADEFVTTVLTQSELDTRDSLKDIYLSKKHPGAVGDSLKDRTMWATFDAKNSSNDPFEGITTSDVLCHEMGLPHKDRGQPFLLFIYAPPATLDLLFPTIGDAYAGSPFNEKFCVPDQGAPCGYIESWSGSKSRPEIVHRPVTGQILDQCVRELL